MNKFTRQRIINIHQLFSRAVEFYDEAIRKVRDTEVSSTLQNVRQTHQQTIEQIQQLLQQTQTTESPGLSVTERDIFKMINVARETLIDSRQRYARAMSSIDQNQALHFITELESIEDLLVKCLDELLEREQNFAESSFVEKEQEHLRDTHDRIKEARDEITEESGEKSE